MLFSVNKGDQKMPESTESYDISSIQVINTIQTEIKQVKELYKRGLIDLKTLQRTAKHLNTVLNSIHAMAKVNNQ